MFHLIELVAQPFSVHSKVLVIVSADYNNDHSDIQEHSGSVCH